MKEQDILVLVVAPDKKPVVQRIPATLGAMQKLVGGGIQAIYPFEKPVALVCNEEGKMNGLRLNRALYDEFGQVYDIIAGTFFLCSAPPDGESFESLTQEQVDCYAKRFMRPEVFLKFEGGILALPV